jgi:LEA14-like dessication related protein
MNLRCQPLVFLAVGGLLVTACATVPSEMEAPKITVANIAPKDFAVFEQRFDVQLRIQNPNDQDLRLKGIRCDIELNDQEFGNGMSGQKVTVPGFGSEVVHVEVITGLGSFLRQFQEINKSGMGKVRYRLKGTAFVESPSSMKLPFEEKGEIDLNLTPAGEKS